MFTVFENAMGAVTPHLREERLCGFQPTRNLNSASIVFRLIAKIREYLLDFRLDARLVFASLIKRTLSPRTLFNFNVHRVQPVFFLHLHHIMAPQFEFLLLGRRTQGVSCRSTTC